MKLPREQAVRIFDQNVCVMASAGSGKTSLLVDRFFHAVTELDYDPGRILAITFTEKAANEMKKKLVEKFEEKSLFEERRKLENAYVSTIHGFCARILKENPVEAGVDPFFRVLGEGETDILIKKILDRLFEEESGNEAWLGILADYGESAVRQSFVKFYEMSRALGEEAVFRFGDGAAERDKTLRNINEELTLFLGSKEPTGAAQEQALAWAALVRDWAAGRPGGWKGVQEVLEILGEKPRKSPKIKEFVSKMEDLLNEWVSWQAQGLALPVKTEWVRMFRKFREAYDEEKKKQASYDFDDLLVLTEKLFSSGSKEKKSLRDRIRDHFQAILVDEFQDTSPLQVKIIHSLRSKNNYFIVGDVQQSIYGFRYAEPRVFSELASLEDKSFHRIVLSENYRSRAEILNFVNSAFLGAFDERFFKPMVPKQDFLVSKKHCLELLCVPYEKDDDTTKDEQRVVEARALAARIQEIVASGLPVQERPVRERPAVSRPIRYSDIALLFRTYSQIRLYENELSRAGIPYFVLKGRGFYEKQEILDILNYLQVIEDPRQDVPLAGILRSPFLNISDDALFWLARRAKQADPRAPLSGALAQAETIGELSADDRDRIVRFRDDLNEMRRRKSERSVPEMMFEILERGSYEAKLLTHLEGKQMVANVRKLVEMARVLEEKGIYGIQEFIFYVKSLSERETPEAQASIQGEASNAVSLSTIHMAKGLEFPFVAIADMGSKPKSFEGGAFLADPEKGFGIKIKNPFSPDFIRDTAYLDIREHQKKREAAESLRLLYVAMTRAREHLLFSGVLALKKTTASSKLEEDEGVAAGPWMEYLVRLLGGAERVLGSEKIDFEGVSIKMVKRAQGLPAKKETRLLIEESAIQAILDGKKSPVKGSDLESLKARLYFKKQYEETADFTVSDLLADSSRGWTPASLEDKDEEKEETTPANEYGNIFHRAMEYLVGSRSSGGAKGAIRDILKPLLEAERKKMELSIERFWKGPWGEAVRKARKVYPELPFIYKTRRGILKGQIDLVFQGQDGQWVVLDYKTNRIQPAEKEALARSYELQVMMYAFVFWKLYNVAPAKVVLYFESINEEVVFRYEEKKYAALEGELDSRFQGLIEKSITANQV